MIPIEEIRRRADKLGIQDIEHKDRTELIRLIQTTEGHSPCFNTDWCKAEWKLNCYWKDECSSKDFFSE